MMSPETQEKRQREKQMERYDRHMNKYGHFSKLKRKPRHPEPNLAEQETKEEGK